MEVTFFVSGIIRLIVGALWLVSFTVFVFAYRNERLAIFRPMRMYAAVLSFVWSFYTFYTAFALLNSWPLPTSIESGLISATLMIPTTGYLIATAWVTHKIVRSWG